MNLKYEVTTTTLPSQTDDKQFPSKQIKDIQQHNSPYRFRFLFPENTYTFSHFACYPLPPTRDDHVT